MAFIKLRNTVRTLSVLSFTSVVAVACSAHEGTPQPQPDEPVSSQVTERLGGGWRYQGSGLECGGDLTGSISRFSRRHVHRIDGVAGENFDITLQPSWPSYLGAVAIVTDYYGEIVEWDYRSGEAYAAVSGSYEYTEPHYLFISPVKYGRVHSSYDYLLEMSCEPLGCSSDLDCSQDEKCVQVQCVTTPCPALCQAQPLCAEVVTSNDNYWAKNFEAGERAEAEAWVAGFDALSSGVNMGRCADLNGKECRDDAPICGQPNWAEYPKTFASLCELQKLVRSGTDVHDFDVNAHFTDGACVENWCATAEVDTGNGRKAFYAKNFATDADAKSWLASTFPNGSTLERLEGTCDEPRPCYKIYRPVCGEVMGEPTEAGNDCEFRGAVMAAAGSDLLSEAKGSYSEGQCEEQCNYDVPGKRYVGESLDMCARIFFVCEPGEEYFTDECGCGCQEI